MKLKPLFKTKNEIKARKCSPKEAQMCGYKQILEDKNKKILIGRNHAYGNMPAWFNEIEKYVNSEVKKGSDTVEVWISTEGFPRGVVVGFKGKKQNGAMNVFGNLSKETLNKATALKTDGWNAFKK